MGGFRADEVETHQTLLKAGIWIIEGLNLKLVPPGRVQLSACLSRSPEATGAPARALVRPMGRFDREKR